MRTECCECDRIAVAFHGPYAYCREHMPEEERKFKPTSLQIDEKRCHKCQKTVRWDELHVCGWNQ